MLAGDKYCSLATQQFVQDNKKYMEMFFFDQNNCQMILPTSIYFNYGANYGFKKAGEVKNTFAFEAANALGVPMNDENKYILAHAGTWPPAPSSIDKLYFVLATYEDHNLTFSEPIAYEFHGSKGFFDFDK